MLDLILHPFSLSLAVALVVTPLIIWIFKKLNWTIDPLKQQHPAHIHTGAIPKGGGVAIALAVTVSSLLFLDIDNHLKAILIGIWFSLAIGLIDDIRGINPYVRLIANFLVALLIVSAGIGIAYITNPFGGIIDLSNPKIVFFAFGETHEIWILADLFALLWIPFLMNAINWSSGIDGQVSGVVAIAAIVIGILSLSFSSDITQWPVSVIAFSLAGSFVGLAFFHFYPQKIMPGYSGTSIAGFLLAVLAILATAKVGTALVVLGLPVIDAIYTGARRIASGKSPVWGDKKHLHHRLLELGWGKRRVALFYWIMTAALGLIALITSSQIKIFAILSLAIIIVGFSLWTYSCQSSKPSGHASG